MSQRTFRPSPPPAPAPTLPIRANDPDFSGGSLEPGRVRLAKAGEWEGSVLNGEPETLSVLLEGDLTRLRSILRTPKDINVRLEIKSDQLLWTSKKFGLWSLEYKRELTSPLCIAATYGYTNCLQHLLQHGAEVNLVPGPRSALQLACANAQPHCVQLLLEYGANPSLLSEEGLSPLHLCDSPHSFSCAKWLLRHRANVNQLSDEEGTSPLHVAAEHGLVEHVLLYLRYGARVDRTDNRGQSPLGSACAQPQSPGSQEAYHQVCQLLMMHGADVNATDGERVTPLHGAARNANHALVQLLLQHHADANAIDYNGSSPLRCALQSAVLKQELQPHCTVQTLLNHGSHRVWPGAFIKVLTICAASPPTIEVLFNSYQQIQVTEEWPEIVPEDVFQVHQSFYKSLFVLASQPRSLQHLCRFEVRKLCGDRCQAIIPMLPVPRCLHGYLLLEPQGWVF